MINRLTRIILSGLVLQRMYTRRLHDRKIHDELHNFLREKNFLKIYFNTIPLISFYMHKFKTKAYILTKLLS